VIVGDASHDELGSSLALSADAKTLVTGAPHSNMNMGYVKVYRTDDDGWNPMQLGQTIYGEAVDDYFGDSVDISRDGRTIAIGAPGVYESSDQSGYVRVYYLESDSLSSSWKQVGQDITGETVGDSFGESISLSEDGTILAFGAWTNDGNGVDSGHVRVYQLKDSGTNWEQLGQDINGDASDDGSGHSVSLSADGKTVAIGQLDNSENSDWSGHVRVYQINSEGSSWEQLGQNIAGVEPYDQFGYWSVTLSPDGKVLAVGAPSYNIGYVRVYYLETNDIGSSWKQIGQDIIGEEPDEGFGISVSMSEDGETLAIGAQSNDGNGANSGRVTVYRWDDSSTSWTQLGEDIHRDAAFDVLGWKVSLSADGRTLAIGSKYTDENGSDSGSVKVFSIT
jgi:6-phosphogluconolactonase (cycloisomerase 2 family)